MQGHTRCTALHSEMAAASAGLATCAVCLSDVAESHKRRKLYGASSVSALVQLKQLAVSCGYGVSGSNSILPAESTGKGFICVKCFSLLQRIAKMREDLAKLEGELENRLSKTAVSLGVQAASSRSVGGSGEMIQ